MPPLQQHYTVESLDSRNFCNSIFFKNSFFAAILKLTANTEQHYRKIFIALIYVADTKLWYSCVVLLHTGPYSSAQPIIHIPTSLHGCLHSVGRAYICIYQCANSVKKFADEQLHTTTPSPKNQFHML